MFNVVKSCTGVPDGAVWFDGSVFHYKDGSVVKPSLGAVMELYNPQWGIDVCDMHDVSNIMSSDGLDSLLCLTPVLEAILHNYNITGGDLYNLFNGNLALVDAEFSACKNNPITLAALKRKVVLNIDGDVCAFGRFISDEDFDEVVGNADGANYVIEMIA